MFKRIKKIWQMFCWVIYIKKKWCWPRQSEVLIFDAIHQGIFTEYLGFWDPEVLHRRWEQINMRVLLASFFRSGSRIDAYVDCFIEKVRPRLIITFIDNNQNFYTISKRHPKVKTLFIQNGWRNYYGDIFELFDKVKQGCLEKRKADYKLVFGSMIGKHYSRHVDGDTVPMGSIKNNMVHKEKSLRLGVIAFVSQWRLSQGVDIAGTFHSFEDFWEKPDRHIIQCMEHYAGAKNKRLMIIPTYSKGSDMHGKEEAYFNELMDGEPEFIELEGPYASYRAIDSAEIVVAIDSTLGYESIARGNKTAIFSIRGTLLGDRSRNYGWPEDFPDKGPFWTNKPDPDSFDRILDYLFEVDGVQWKKDVAATGFSSLMAYDPGNTMLKAIFEKELGAPPTRVH